MEREVIAKAYREKKAAMIITAIILPAVFVLFGVGIFILIQRDNPNTLWGLKIFFLVLFSLIAITVDVLYFIHTYKQNHAKEEVITYDALSRTFYIETKSGVREAKAKAITKAYINDRHALYNGSFLASSHSKNGPIIINIEGEKRIKSFVVNDIEVVNFAIKRICGIHSDLS